MYHQYDQKEREYFWLKTKNMQAVQGKINI